MKFPCYVYFTLVLFFASSAGMQAQIEFSKINFKPKSILSDVEKTLDSRPRIYVKTSEAKPNVSAPMTVLDLERQAFQLINEKRREQGLKELEWSESIAKIARLHSQNMADNKFFSHTGLDGSIVSDRADKSGLKKWRAIGENIAYNRGYKQPIEFAVERWLQSSSHKQNLLNKEWQESAVGIAVTPEGTYYFTQVFLLRK
ncbi:MAG: CAP domain-containing protein [Acidobacteriota bacterium]|nr:CAP domain-containing protein [Acidobacteriota bacterium]